MRIAIITAALLASTVAFAADDKPDFMGDKVTYTCDKDIVDEAMKELKSERSNPFEPRIVYVKTSTEVSRAEDHLVCKISMKLSNGRIQDGYFTQVYEDGHALVGFKSRLPEYARKKGSKV